MDPPSTPVPRTAIPHGPSPSIEALRELTVASAREAPVAVARPSVAAPLLPPTEQPPTPHLHAHEPLQYYTTYVENILAKNHPRQLNKTPLIRAGGNE